MQLALYEPVYGYYSAGNIKFNQLGDFITAPELTTLFGYTLTQQIIQILERSQADTILEFGAGTGSLAKSILQQLAKQDIKVNYQILELSADLRQRQQENLAEYGQQVQWLEQLPTSFTGCVLANEVLDAMPVTLFRYNDQLDLEILAVKNTDDPETAFAWDSYPANSQLAEIIQQRTSQIPLYQSEINLQAETWINSMGNWLNQGAAILIDYGFPQREYYHPQRNQGTLMCHLRHFAHDQALIYPGIQDITAHIDFTAIADAALDAGMDVLGYTSQARFLLNCGLTDLLSQIESAQRTKELANVNILLSEAEMGELFKVMVVGKNIEPGLTGFSRSDRRDFL